MAFPVPDHLPRAGFGHEGTSFGSTSNSAEPFLKKIAALNGKAINHQIASSLSKELEEAIAETKVKLRSRIAADLPSFEGQLELSQLVQSRLRSLTTSVEDLDGSLNSESGLRPVAVRALQAHSNLAQLALDESTSHDAFVHLLQCRTGYIAVGALVNEGRLEQAVAKSRELETLLAGASNPLRNAKVILEMQRKLKTVQARIQELLNDAYKRCVVITTSGSLNVLSIMSPVEVSQAASLITLRQVLTCMEPDVVQRNLAALRKEILIKFVDPLLSRPSSIRIRNKNSFELHSSTFDVTPPLANLSALMEFISQSLFPSLPTTHASFPNDLYAPTTDALLVKLLQPAIPSQVFQLPPFLTLVAQAAQVEQSLHTLGITPTHGRGNTVEEWCNNVSNHYEKKRRESLLQHARDVIITQDNLTEIRVEVPGISETAEPELNATPRSIASSGVVVEAISSQQGSDEGEGGDSGWDFDDDLLEGKAVATPPDSSSLPHLEEAEPPQDAVEEDGWGFDDDAPIEIEEHSSDTPQTTATKPGLGEWDNEEPPSMDHAHAKPAKRLEKFSSRQGSGATSKQPSNLPPSNFNLAASPTSPDSAYKKPTPLERPKAETYTISSVAKAIFTAAQQAVQEGHALQDSDAFSLYSKSPASRGSLLYSTASSIFDLYRALHPPIYTERLQATISIHAITGDGMKLFNDCTWLASQIDVLLGTESLTPDEASQGKLTEARQRLRSMGEMWYDDSLDQATSKIIDVLSQTERFTESGDDSRFAQYQGTVDEVVREITMTSTRWRDVLTLSKHHEALGSLVDECLRRFIDDITSLPDIPELESHRLGDLCRLMNPLEELFLQQTADGQQSVIVNYVPLWLKFSYLAELLVASLADISYLFDQGALIDFDIEELTRLVRALFAETPLRAKTIQRLSSGHPTDLQ